MKALVVALKREHKPVWAYWGQALPSVVLPVTPLTISLSAAALFERIVVYLDVVGYNLRTSSHWVARLSLDASMRPHAAALAKLKFRALLVDHPCGSPSASVRSRVMIPYWPLSIAEHSKVRQSGPCWR